MSTQYDWKATLWIAPAVALMAALFLIPVGYGLYLGFTNIQLVGPFAIHYQFTALDNLQRMIDDQFFWDAVKRTLIFAAVGIVGQSLLGLSLALLMRQALRPLQRMIGAIVLITWVLPEVAAAFVWYAFAQEGGTLGLILGQPTENFLVSIPLAIVTVANIWRTAALAMLIFSAALRALPADLDEAAQMDGASYWQRLVHITLPLLRPTIVTNLLLSSILGLSNFTLIYAMTQGGPGNDTTILPLYMYRVAFQFSQLGYGSAIALSLIILAAGISTLYIWHSRQEFAS